MRFNLASVAALTCFSVGSIFGRVTVTPLPVDFVLRAISDDGRVAVGSFNMAGTRWTVDAGLVPNEYERYSSFMDVSADGLVSVGFSGRYGPSAYWRGSEQQPYLLPGGSNFFETATSVSANGRVIIGAGYQFSTPGATP